MKIDGYKFGNKNNWRRWAWNRISERVPVAREDATILYLPGSEDLDRGIAVEHGFSPENMIAVDRNDSVVRKLRDKGALCVCGDLIDTIHAFDGNRKIDVVVADLCCGVTDYVRRLCVGVLSSFEFSVSDEAIFAINLMRGRDPGEILSRSKARGERHRGKMIVDYLIAEHVKAVKASGQDSYKSRMADLNKWFLSEEGKSLEEYLGDTTIEAKCREALKIGGIKSMAVAKAAAKAASSLESLEAMRKTLRSMLPVNPCDDASISRHIDDVLDSLRPQYFTYKSGPILMDSVVFSCDESKTQFRCYSCEPSNCLDSRFNGKYSPSVDRIKKSLNAIYAVRTRRIYGSLPRVASV